MPPNKSKRSVEDTCSPEERRSKRKKLNEDDEEEEKEREPISKGKGSSSKKTPAFGGVSTHKPAELFRKDLISAMKLADSEPLSSEDYLLIADSWRQEWERGVQVPVNEVSLKAVELRNISDQGKTTGDFKIPKKHLHENKDETYQLGVHEHTGMQQLSEQVVRYDLDDLDVSWLTLLNEQREEVGDEMIHEWTMERVIETLENQCHENMEIRKKTDEGLGIEYDEDIVCEICHSPDSEDCNEMVFCDGCDICVHQACYGIQKVPEGSWLCRTCALGIKPACILCPKVGGAMKSTRSGTKWAHVSCAIWIPEVTIGCVDKMEPITKISQVPASRWSLICVICKERCGACIQCSVKACKTAFHVTCAFAEKLEMKTVLIEDKNIEDIKLKAYCPKHSKKRDRNNSESEPDSPRKSISGTPIKGVHEMSEEERAKVRAERLHKLEEEFYKLITISEIATQLVLSEEIVDLIFVFWKLKRKSLHNRPLLTPKTEEADLLEKQQEDSLVARMKMFVHLRQDLERVRNLSYMIGKREKIKRQFNRARESVFYATLEVLTDKSLTLTSKEVDKIVHQYRDLPAPYGKDAQYSKDAKKGKSFSVLKAESRKSIEKDWDTLSVCSTQSAKSKVPRGDKGSGKSVIKTESKAKKSIAETPKSRKSRLKSEQEPLDLKQEVKSELEATDIKESDLSQSDANNSAMDTSEIDIGPEDETLVNTSAIPTESESQSLKSPSQPQKSKKLARNRVSVGKIEKRNKNVVDKQPDKPTEEMDGGIGKIDSVKSGRKSRARSCLQEDVPNEIKVKTEEITDNLVPDLEEPLTQNSLVRASSTPVSEKPSHRERRQSAAVKLSEEEKQELVSDFPSAKNVSDHIKAELNGYLKNNKLIVSNKLRQKVQYSLLNGKRRNRLSNGIIIDHSQKKIESFFAKSPPHCDTSYKSPAKNVSRVLNELSPTRDRFEANNIERTASLRGSIKVSEFQIQRRSGNTPTRCSPLLHITDRAKSLEKESVVDGSPDYKNCRKRYNSTNVTSVREKLFDSDKKQLTRSSRESTPESCTGSVRSLGSYKRDKQGCDPERTPTRSITPLSSVEKDYENEANSENFCEETKKRRTRSQHIDEPVSREGSASPCGQNTCRSHIESVGT